MLLTYRDIDYSAYNNAQHNFCCIRYDALYHNFQGALYGRRGLGFYYPNFEVAGFSNFSSNHRDAVSLLSAQMNLSLIRGHIINAALDGETTSRNLVPLTYTANTRHKSSETKVKRMVKHLSRLGKQTTYVVGYEVIVTSNQNGVPVWLALEANVYYLSNYGELHIAPNQMQISQTLSGSGVRINLPVTDGFDPLM